jgi:S1-C subfamily serine protease
MWGGAGPGQGRAACPDGQADRRRDGGPARMDGQPSGRCGAGSGGSSWRKEDPMAQIALELGDTFSQAVEVAAPSVVRLAGRRGVAATGFVWDDAGTIVTSLRLVAAACGDLELTCAAGERRDPEVVGGDPVTDVAVLRVDPAGLVPLVRHDADDLKVGQPVLALGRPGGGIRASLRIIGVLGRDVRTPGGRLERYVESDRGFPRGFAGGPLVDLAGAAIGLDTPYAVRGADLTIPVVTLARVVGEIAAHGAVRRGYLGVGVQRARLPQAIAAALGRATGALVVSVDDASPAAGGGVLLGDVLVELDGAPVDGPDGLRQALVDRGGATAALRLLRAGALLDLPLTVGQRGAR